MANLIFAFLILSLTYSFFGESKETPTEQFVIKAVEGNINGIIEELSVLKVNFLRKINVSSGYYLFEDTNHGGDRDVVSNFLLENSHLRNKIIQFERVREYDVDLEPDREEAAAASSNDYHEDSHFKHCPTFSNMGVEEVWNMGYTGSDIVVAVLDVGMNTSIPDLKHQTRKDLSFNLVANSSNVVPDMCIYDTGSYSDHGNRCAGVISAEKNEKCGEGISYGAKLVAIKIFKIIGKPYMEQCSLDFKTTWIAEGLVHELNNVDIYSSSWGSGVHFFNRSSLIADAIRTGAKKGRGGKGAVYVFPSEYLADPFTNDIHTIAVSGVGGRGQIPPFATVCACTLTSAYAERSKKSKVALFTTSNYQNHCTLDFEGVSAATAIVSGIIGLALQANSALSMRDVQDLIVQASDVEGLQEKNDFLTNGAGKKYHPKLGFGLLNATRLAHLAHGKHRLPEQMKMTSRCGTITRKQDHHIYDFADIEINCSAKCINRTENVVVELSYETPHEHDCEIILTSPMDTSSLLMDRKQSSVKGRVVRRNVMFKSVNFWGENAEGRWELQLKQHRYHSDFQLRSCKINVFGTGYLVPSYTTAHRIEKEEMSTRVQKTVTENTYSTRVEGSQTLDNNNSNWFVYVVVILFFIIVVVGVTWFIERLFPNNTSYIRIRTTD